MTSRYTEPKQKRSHHRPLKTHTVTAANTAQIAATETRPRPDPGAQKPKPPRNTTNNSTNNNNAARNGATRRRNQSRQATPPTPKPRAPQSKAKAKPTNRGKQSQQKRARPICHTRHGVASILVLEKEELSIEDVTCEIRAKPNAKETPRRSSLILNTET